jgi:Tfp pilus assembly protein PilN
VREPEFLPDWYPQTRKQRRLVVLQGWLILTLVGGIATYAALADRNIRADEATRASLQAQVDQTNAQLAEMDKLDVMRQQLSQQEQIVSRLGFYVEACKAVNTVDSLMPKQMSLTGLVIENEEKVDNSAMQQARGSSDTVIDRRLKVKLQGVCPTDMDLANFMTQLNTVPFFEQVNITYSREKSDNAHVMREFEASFFVGLTAAGN